MFKLGIDELKRLRQVTVNNVTYAKLTQILMDLRPSKNIEEFSLGNDLTLVTLTILQNANAQGWIDKFIIGLYALYPAVDEISEFHDSVIAARASIPATPPATAPSAVTGMHPLDDFTVVYVDNRPFVNRRALRSTLKKLAASNGPRILKILGEPRTGKSYTHYLISHLARQFGFRIVPIDLLSFAELTPYDIGCSINSRMGLPDPAQPGKEQWSRWTRRYFDRLSGHVQSAEAPAAPRWWIIMDNFKAVTVPEALNDFVDDLATRIDRELLDVRAVLISYERRLPSHVDPIVVEDKTCDIGVEELSEFFIQFYLETKPHLDTFDRTKRAAAKVAEVIVKSGHAPGSPLDGIGAELLTQCRKIMEEVP
jgi:hypothetical protein